MIDPVLKFTLAASVYDSVEGVSKTPVVVAIEGNTKQLAGAVFPYGILTKTARNRGLLQRKTMVNEIAAIVVETIGD